MHHSRGFHVLKLQLAGTQSNKVAPADGQLKDLEADHIHVWEAHLVADRYQDAHYADLEVVDKYAGVAVGKHLWAAADTHPAGEGKYVGGYMVRDEDHFQRHLTSSALQDSAVEHREVEYWFLNVRALETAISSSCAGSSWLLATADDLHEYS